MGRNYILATSNEKNAMKAKDKGSTSRQDGCLKQVNMNDLMFSAKRKNMP